MTSYCFHLPTHPCVVTLSLRQDLESNLENLMSSFQDYPRISPFLWFGSNAEAAADFYVSIFPKSRKLGQMLSSVDTPSAPAGAVLTVSFELDGLKFTALNGGPDQKFNQAVSF